MKMRPFLLFLFSPSLAAAMVLLNGDSSRSGDDCSNAAWDQCGGTGFGGDSCCPAGYNCTYQNEWFSGCSLEDLCLVIQFGQCGGTDADGNPWPEDQKCCPDGFSCAYTNPYYRCVGVCVYFWFGKMIGFHD